MRILLVPALLVATACATTPTTSPVPKAQLPSGPPHISAGRPTFEGRSGGFFIWADDDGWHLRTTSAGQLASFTGVISPIGGELGGLRPMRANDRSTKVSLTDKGIEFSLPTQAEVEGFDWTVTSGCNRFDLLALGEANPGLVRLGGMADAPPQIPFDLCK
jgi:hypothetical protein